MCGFDLWAPVTSLQTPTPESLLTTAGDEPEVPVSGGPSGDFELPEEETTQPDTANEVVAVGGAAAKPSPPPGTLPKGSHPGPGLLDNAIDSGSSAAQLPQKSILERKEVLVGEDVLWVGGLGGACSVAASQACCTRDSEGVASWEKGKLGTPLSTALRSLP